MMTFIRKLFCCLPVGATLLLVGCLEYESQELQYRYDAGEDTLRIFQTYEGIYGDKDPERVTDQELRYLQEALQSHDAFFPLNYIQKARLSEMQERLRSLESGDMQEPRMPEDLRREMADLLRAIIENTTIHCGPLYLNEAGRISMAHQTTIRNMSVCIRRANRFFRLLCSQEPAPSAPPEVREAFEAAVEGSIKFIQIKKGRILLHMPMVEQTYAELKEGFAEHSDGGVELSFDGRLMEAKFGVAGAEIQRIRVEEKSEYVPNLIAVQDQLPELVDAEAVAALRVEFLGTPKRKRSLRPWRR